MDRIVICSLEYTFTIPDEIINESDELAAASLDHANTLSDVEIWKQEKNYIIHENGIDVALFEKDLQLSK